MMTIRQELLEPGYNSTKFGVDCLRWAAAATLGFAAGHGILAAWGIKTASLVVSSFVSTHLAAVPNLLYPVVEKKVSRNPDQYVSLLGASPPEETRCVKVNKHLHGFLAIASGMAVAGAATTFGAPVIATTAVAAATAGFFSVVVSRGQIEANNKSSTVSLGVS